MRFDLTVLGTNSALPAFGRYPSAQVLNIQEQLFLIDCGEGTQMRMLDHRVRKNKIDQIFISHLHGDHVYGLIGLLTSFALNGREKPMKVFSPPGLKRMIDIQLESGGGGLPYPVQFHELIADRHYQIFEDKRVEVFAFPLLHRIPTSGFLFREKERPRNMRPEMIERYNIPYQKIPGIKQGNDLTLEEGQVIKNEELTIAPPRPRSFAYCSDTLYTEEIIPYIKGVDLLYHESTFCKDKKEQAIVTMHSTAAQAATIARKAGVRQLILGHYSSRYRNLNCFEEEARRIFPNTILGKEGMVVEVSSKQ